jgi:hypothetical protein
MADEVGSGQVAVFPTFRGFRAATNQEMDAAGKEGGSRITSGIRSAFGALAGAVAAVGVGRFFVEGVRDASQLEQSVGAVSAIFKDSAGQINQWADSAATDVGLTKNEFNELGTLIGAQLKNGGTAMDQLAPKTNDLITLGADLASMFGGDTKTAVSALSSALKGERDPIEAYGVSLSQAKIDAEAAALGFKKVGGTLSAEANQAATLSLIMKQTADAHGNFASEADTLAGKQQRLNAIWKNGKTAIAGAFLPAVSAVTGWLVDKLPGGIDKAVLFTNRLVDTFAYIRGYVTGEGANVDIGWLEGPAERIGQFIIWGQVAAIQIRDMFAYIRGYVSGEGANVDIGWLEGPAEAIGTAIIAIQSAIKTGDLGQLGGAFDGFMAVAKPAGPILLEVGKALGDMSTEVGALVGSALPLLPPLLSGATSAMQFLAQNTGILKAAIVAIAAAFVIYRAGQVAANVASLGAVPVALAQAGANITLASAIRANTAATASGAGITRAAAGSEIALTAAKSGGILANIRAAASTVAARVAMAAGAVATGVATAAQWALNAAMSANPIALVVLAIAALVAGLVWFFTQTELGRTIWAGFVGFLGDAWNNIVAAITLTLQILSQVFQAVWAAIVSFVTGYVTGVAQTILRVMAGISSAWSAGWSAIGSFFSGIWNGILSFVRSIATGVQSAVAGLVSAVSSKVGEAVSFVQSLPGKALAAIGDVGSKLFSSGQALVQGWIDGIKNMAGAVGRAVSNVVQGALNFFPNSPAKEGPLRGPGWRKLRKSGAAVIEQWTSGMDSTGFSAASVVARAVRPTSEVPDGAGARGQQTSGGITIQGDVHTQDLGAFASVLQRAADRSLMSTTGRKLRMA